MAEQPPSKAHLNKYLNEVKTKTESWIQGLDESDYHATESLFPWTGSTVLGMVLYSLEHCHQHLGELNGELRRRGLPTIKWSYFK